jgi:hypothetical protein
LKLAVNAKKKKKYNYHTNFPHSDYNFAQQNTGNTFSSVDIKEK